MTSDKSTSLEERLNALIQGDTWHTISLNGSWTGSLKYRYEFDLRSVRLKFTRSNPGTLGDGTAFTIATLPAAYRPNSDTEMALTTDKTGSSGQSPHVFIEASSGNVNVYGIGSGAINVSLNGTFGIFDD